MEAISASDPEEHPLSSFLDRERLEELNLLKELIVRTLVDRHEQVRWHAEKRLAYFRKRGEQQQVEYAWGHPKPRAVVRAGFSKDDDGHFTGYRHDAAELAVRGLDDGWALQITPTYLFTWDGVQLSGHHDKALAGIKRFDRHRAVSSSLRMWQHLFTERQTLMAPAPHEFFRLGPLLSVEVPFSINASDWAEMSEQEAEAAQGSGLEQDPLFDLEDEE